jgi:hypothetical protein
MRLLLNAGHGTPPLGLLAFAPAVFAMTLYQLPPRVL